MVEYQKVFRHVGFFVRLGRATHSQSPGTHPMAKPNSTMRSSPATRQASSSSRGTGHVPKSVSVVLNKDMLVIRVQEALSPAEKAVAKSPAGIAQLQEFHRQLFASSSGALRREINRITGAEVREASAEVETATGAVMQMFTTGTVVQVFLLSRSVPDDTWSGSGLTSN